MPNRITRERVEQWIEELGLNYNPCQLEEDVPYEWGMFVDGQAFRMFIGQRVADFNYLEIQAVIGIAQNHRQALRDLNEVGRTLFLFDLRLALNQQQSVDYLITMEQGDSKGVEEHPVNVVLSTNLANEPLERLHLLRGNHAIQTAAQTVALMFQKMAYRGAWP